MEMPQNSATLEVHTSLSITNLWW